MHSFFTFCCVEDLGEGFGSDEFARLSLSCRKLQLSLFEHCPSAFHCQQPQTSLFTVFDPLILDHGACFKISISGLKILHSQVLLNTSFYHCLQSMIIRSSFLLMNLHSVQFQYGLEFLRLSYPQFVQILLDVIRWNL